MMEDQKTRLQLPSLAVNWCKMCFGFGSQTQQHRPHGSIHSHYEIGRVLGSGRFGQVRLGKDRNTGQLVAIKIVKTEKQGPRRNFDVIKREVEALKRLEHPNIARFIATFEEHEYDTTTIPPPPTPTSTTTTSNANNNDNNTPTPSRSKPTPTPTTPTTSTTSTSSTSSSRSRLFIVTELVTGGEVLQRLITKKSLKEDEVRRVVRGVLVALKYMNDKGIVHRDLKPENILFAHSGDDSPIKIVDFGASALLVSPATADTAFSNQTDDGYDDCTDDNDDDIAKTMHEAELFATVIGTPLYLAPEVIRVAHGKRVKYGKEVDMWSTGIIAYILLSGTLPFDDDNMPRLFGQITRAEYSFPSPLWDAVSGNAIDFVTRCLHTDPWKRLTPEQGLRHPWLLSGYDTDSSLDASGVDLNALAYYRASQRYQHITRVIGTLRQLKNLVRDQSLQENHIPNNHHNHHDNNNNTNDLSTHNHNHNHTTAAEAHYHGIAVVGIDNVKCHLVYDDDSDSDSVCVGVACSGDDTVDQGDNCSHVTHMPPQQLQDQHTAAMSAVDVDCVAERQNHHQSHETNNNSTNNTVDQVNEAHSTMFTIKAKHCGDNFDKFSENTRATNTTQQQLQQHSLSTLSAHINININTNTNTNTLDENKLAFSRKRENTFPEEPSLVLTTTAASACPPKSKKQRSFSDLFQLTNTHSTSSNSLNNSNNKKEKKLKHSKSMSDEMKFNRVAGDTRAKSGMMNHTTTSQGYVPSMFKWLQLQKSSLPLMEEFEVSRYSGSGNGAKEGVSETDPAPVFLSLS